LQPENCVLMTEADLRICERALRVIQEYLTKNHGFRSLIGDLRGTIALLAERQADLSRSLNRKWRVLEETNARIIYRKLSATPPDYQALINATLEEIRALILAAVSEAELPSG
jgi:hypothetical protein